MLNPHTAIESLHSVTGVGFKLFADRFKWEKEVLGVELTQTGALGQLKVATLFKQAYFVGSLIFDLGKAMLFDQMIDQSI